MLVAAAVCPHPPLLVPALASGAATELDRLRAACDEAVAAVLAAGVDDLVVVGADPAGGTYGSDAGASLRPYGVDTHVGGAGAALPLALAVGAYLLDRVDPTAARRYVGVRPDAGTDACLAIGRALVDGPGRVGLLVLGDGSSRRTDASPGRFDERAAGIDDAVVAALAAGDAATLAALDPVLAGELVLGGRAAWQVLAGAAYGAGDGPGSRSSPAPLDARVVHAEAPYGVLYVVARWVVTG